MWQVLCWLIVAPGEAIRRSEATGGDGRPAAHADRSTPPSQAGGHGQQVTAVNWWRALLDRAAVTIVAVGGALLALYLARALAAAIV